MAEIQSLARGLKILNILSQSPDGIGTIEVSKRLGVDKSSASRLLQTLANYGFAEQNDDNMRYYLGPQVLSLSRYLLNRIPLRDHARPYLHQLVERTGECAHLAIMANNQALYIDQVQSPAVLRVESEIGTLSPLHCTALGKVLLTFGDASMNGEFKSYTQRTITDRPTLEAQIEQTRQRGYAIDDEEYNYGVRCVAAPVYDHTHQLVGTIGISGPGARVTLESIDQFGQLVMQTAEELSSRLGYS